MSANLPDSPSELVPVLVDHEGRKWPMFKGPEPVCKDTDLAAWLDFERPRDIRKLILRWSVELGVLTRHRVAKVGTDERPAMGRPEEPYYLTEDQTLFIIAKSKTPRATWMLRAMIAVFLKARGLVEVAAPTSPNLAKLQALHQELTGHRVELDMIGNTLQAISDKQHETKREFEQKMAAQREYIELLDAKVNRGLTKEQREELAAKVSMACDCRASVPEKQILWHVAKEGPATSLARIRAAQGVCANKSSQMVNALVDRGLLEIEQRDPVMPKLRNYFVIADGLHGHADGCQKFALESLDNMMRLTDDAAVHVVPPALGPNLETVPQVLPALQLVEPDTCEAKTDRELLVKLVSTYGKLHDYQPEDFHRAYNRIYANLATQGLECRGKVEHRSGKKIKPIDVVEARGWAGRALEIARQLFPLPVERSSAGAVH